MLPKTTVSVVLLCLLASSPVVSQTLNRCLPFFTNERVAFDLTGIDASNSGKEYDITLGPHLNPKTNMPVLTGNIIMKACSPATKPASCPDVPGGAFAYYIVSGTCIPFVLLTSPQGKEVITVNSKINGVVLSYNNDNLSDEQKKVVPNLRLKVTCNKDKTGAAQWTQSTSGDYFVLTAEHASGCGTALEDVLELVKAYKWIFALVFICIGVIFTFFGKSAYKWTLLLTGFILGFMIVALISYSFGLFHNSTDTTKYIILGVSLVVGILAGFILYKMETVTVMLVCGVLSSLIVMAIMSTFFANTDINKYLVLAIVIGVGVIGGFLGGYFKE